MGICVGMYGVLGVLYILYRKNQDSLKRYKEVSEKIVVLLFCVNTLVLVLELGSRAAVETDGKVKIERNGYGEGYKEETFRMRVEGEAQEEVRIRVSPRTYSEEEVREMFRQAMAVLEQELLGKNESVDHVETDLHLPDKVEGFPVTVVWELSRYDVMDMTGRIKNEVLQEADPGNEGLLVTVTGILRCEEEEAVFSTEVRLFRAAEKEAGIRERVLAMVKDADEREQEEMYLALPQSIDGKKISWKREEASKAVPILFLGIIGSFLLVCLERQKDGKRRKERSEQMLLDYPEIISQFTMLMGAGMTAKSVWKKVAEDYQEQYKRTERKRYAYEEILYTWQEMQGGVPEHECYERFAHRCELLPYMKFGVLLAQNLKKGARGISQMLQMEAVQAMEERKSRARRLGEEAGTKLLLPMLLMLVIVLTIVVVPAFFSIQL